MGRSAAPCAQPRPRRSRCGAVVACRPSGLLAAVLVCLFAAACTSPDRRQAIPTSQGSAGPTQWDYWPTAGWRTAAPTNQGMDPAVVGDLDGESSIGGASAVRAGLGGIWVTYSQTDSVVRLDPSTGKIVATIPVASGPRFFDVGAGAVWVMAQSAGVLCRIDPADNRLVGCTVIDPAGVDGGDLTVGNGFVWFRGTEALVAQVDPKSGKVVRRIGPGEGSGSAGAGSGQLWISAHDVSKLYRVPVRS